jgi:outer membrane receptor protein involved in Fe transport
MQTRNPVGAWSSVLVAVLTLIGFAASSAAQPVGGDAAGAGVEKPDAESPAASKPETKAPAAAQPKSKARKGIEEIVIQAGESEAAADFEAGDSVTGFDASDLEALGAASIADLATFTPNLEIVTTGATTPTFFIRGVGLNDFGANSTSAVAIYRDDVPINAPALQLGTIFDLEGVNILRGPQGSGAARNASAGAIKIYSRRPSGNFGAFLNSSFGNFNARDFQGAVEAPIFEDILSARFAFRYLERDGWMKNRCGDAPPAEDRGVALVRGTAPFDADGNPLSICGEEVLRVGTIILPFQVPLLRSDGKSVIEEGLPTRVNNRNSWAARGMLLFRPTLDMEWTLRAYGERRDEQSRLGQTYGTLLQTFDPDCPGYMENPISPPAECRIRGTLGGQDSGSYVAPEIPGMVHARDSCVDEFGEQTGSCSTAEAAISLNQARLEVAKILSEDLDDEPFAGDFNRVGPTTNDVWGVTLKGDIVLGNSINMTTVTSYDTYDRFTSTDLDQSPNVLFEFETDDEGWQFYQGFDFSGDFGDQIPVRWNLGAYYLMEELHAEIQNFFPPEVLALGVSAREYTQKIWSLGGYAGFEWDFLEDFTLDGGFRYNWEKKSIDYILERGSTISNEPLTDFQDATFQAPTGTIRLTYRFREDTHAYWKYTRGFKAGHYNATSTFSIHDPERTGVQAVEPETIDSFEVGMRGSWFTGRLNANFSLFHYNYTDYQIFTAVQRFGGQPEFVVLNANTAEVYGSELEGSARPFPGTFIEARFAWLESQFLDFVQIQQSTEQIGLGTLPVNIEIQNTGNRLLNSPQFKLSLTAEQEIQLGRFGKLVFRWDGAWSSDTNFDATATRGVPNAQGNQFLGENTVGQQAYWLHNGRVAYTTPNGMIEVAGFVRNAFNEAYKVFAFDNSTFNRTTIYNVGDPRTYGVSVTATF